VGVRLLAKELQTTTLNTERWTRNVSQKPFKLSNPSNTEHEHCSHSDGFTWSEAVANIQP